MCLQVAQPALTAPQCKSSNQKYPGNVIIISPHRAARVSQPAKSPSTPLQSQTPHVLGYKPRLLPKKQFETLRGADERVGAKIKEAKAVDGGPRTGIGN